MKTTTLLTTALALGGTSLALADSAIPSTATPSVIVSTADEPVAPGKFQPTWQSLEQYRAPEWFRDLKFGIWAHWGPQCQPEAGDWYARGMYEEGKGQYKSHLAAYGHPSKSGFKDVINTWKAENFDPDKLVALYKRTGAQYFFALANHHDNLDLWDSKYQPWNSVAVGPHKDLIAGWAKAARAQGLPFGLSVHAAHAWSWYETSQGADKNGPLAGVPYDGKLTKADGKGQWWDGLDPQDLYAQNHTPGKKLEWDWNAAKGSSVPDAAYCQKFYNRTMDLINKYQPELIYFDDTALPLWPVTDAGIKISAHFYNTNLRKPGAVGPGVLFGKILTDQQRKCMVWDIERGVPATALPDAWQTDTCIGGWHYNRGIYDRNGYKSAKTVVHMLADIVSKNGNLLLNIPVRGDGTIDEKEQKVLEGIAAWMDVNKDAIFSTRPWKTFGEGPASDGAPISAQGFNEGKGKPFTAADVRYTASKDGRSLYAIVLGLPTGPVTLKSLGTTAALLDRPIAKVEQLGSIETLVWSLGADALTVTPASAKPASEAALVFKITLK
ncbi:MAG TPA: alpha-L-fucosidase [Rariglobus sp.]|nr:alpha-L-fucosidase [Rariglobus sp.]